MKACPMVFIGVGSTGLNIVEEIQRLHHFNAPVNDEFSWVRFVCIETEKGTNFASYIDSDNTQLVSIQCEYPATVAKKLEDECGPMDWVPKEIPKMPVGDKLVAGKGIPGNGRFILRANFSKVSTAIDMAIKTVIVNAERKNTAENNRLRAQGEQQYSTPDPVVFVVGSLNGGTGAGTFIDIACMVKQVANVLPFGLFLLPTEADSESMSIGVGNAYGALKALALFDGPEDTVKYDEQFPGKVERFRTFVPAFRFVQFLSATPQQGPPISFSKLVNMAGLYLYLNRLGFANKWRGRFEDAEGNSQFEQYATFGISGVHLPKDEILSYAALELGIKLVSKRWLNKTEYYDDVAGAFDIINDTNVRKVVKADLKDLLDEVLNASRERFNANLTDIFRAITERNADVQEILTNRFRRQGELYGIVKGDLSFLETEFIDRIAAKNREICNDFESISLSEKYLEMLGQEIAEAANFWKNIQRVESWGELLQQEVNYFRNSWSETIKRERLYSLFELLNKHFLVPVLSEISTYIISQKVTVRSTETATLPYVGLYQQITAKLNPLVTPDGHNAVNFNVVKGAIKAEITDKDAPFERVYPPLQGLDGAKPGSFDDEVTKMLEKFQGEANRNSKLVTSYKNLNNLNQGLPDFWGYITEAGKDTGVIHEDVRKTYETLLKDNNCVDTYSVSDYLRDHLGTLKYHAEKAIIPLLHIKPQNDITQQEHFVESMKAVLGPGTDTETTKIEAVIAQLHKENVLHFPDRNDNKFGSPSLENFTFFFKQFANFKPLEDLAGIETMKRMYSSGSGAVEDNIRKRTAYYLPSIRPIIDA